MHANLVRAPGNRARLHEGVFPSGVEHGKMRFGFLAGNGIDLHATDVVPVLGNLELTGPFLSFGDSLDDGEITLLNTTRFEQVADGIQGTAAFGHQKNSGGLRIQPMNMTKEFQITRAS